MAGQRSAPAGTSTNNGILSRKLVPSTTLHGQMGYTDFSLEHDPTNIGPSILIENKENWQPGQFNDTN